VTDKPIRRDERLVPEGVRRRYEPQAGRLTAAVLFLLERAARRQREQQQPSGDAQASGQEQQFWIKSG
jgi:hypothetical protein